MNRYASSYSRPNRSGRRRVWFAALLILVLFTTDHFSAGGVRRAVRDTSMGVTIGLQRAYAAVFGSGYFVTRSSLEAQIRELEAERAGYQEKAAAYDALAQDRAELAKLVHFASTTQGVTAPVISSLRSSPYGTFAVGAGKADGILLGYRVLTPMGFVIGTVTQVDTHSSLVKAITASGEQFDIVIDGVNVSAQGVNGWNAVAKVPRTTKVTEGDVAVAPEYGARPVGVVGHVDTGSASAYSTVYFGLPENVSGLRYVRLTP